MKNNLQISIPNPCSENWNEMQPNGCGRFCQSCQKTVTDFTRMSDEDFIAHFQNTKTISCGRFTERQLALEIPAKTTPLLPFWKMSKYVAASMIAAAGLSGKVFGQKVQVEQTTIENETKKEDVKSLHESFISLVGIVVGLENDGIPGANIEVQNSNITTTTDTDGKFNLVVPQSSLKNGYLYLTVKSLGYMKLLKAINQKDYYGGISVKLELEQGVNGGFDILVKGSKWNRFKKWIKTNFL